MSHSSTSTVSISPSPSTVAPSPPPYTVSPPPSHSSTPSRSKTATQSPSSHLVHHDDDGDDDDGTNYNDDGTNDDDHYSGSSGSSSGAAYLHRCYPSTAGKCITSWDVCVDPTPSGVCPAGTNPFFCPTCRGGTQGPCRNADGVCTAYADNVHNRCAHDSIECYKDTLSLPAQNVCPPCIMGTSGPCQNPYSRVCYGTSPCSPILPFDLAPLLAICEPLFAHPDTAFHSPHPPVAYHHHHYHHRHPR
jgi:hypothetical protein